MSGERRHERDAARPAPRGDSPQTHCGYCTAWIRVATMIHALEEVQCPACKRVHRLAPPEAGR